jgi:hypothetical protein
MDMNTPLLDGGSCPKHPSYAQSPSGGFQFQVVRSHRRNVCRWRGIAPISPDGQDFPRQIQVWHAPLGKVLEHRTILAILAVNGGRRADSWYIGPADQAEYGSA